MGGICFSLSCFLLSWWYHCNIPQARHSWHILTCLFWCEMHSQHLPMVELLFHRWCWQCSSLSDTLWDSGKCQILRQSGHVLDINLNPCLGLICVRDLNGIGFCVLFHIPYIWLNFRWFRAQVFKAPDFKVTLTIPTGLWPYLMNVIFMNWSCHMLR